MSRPSKVSQLQSTSMLMFISYSAEISYRRIPAILGLGTILWAECAGGVVGSLFWCTQGGDAGEMSQESWDKWPRWWQCRESWEKSSNLHRSIVTGRWSLWQIRKSKQDWCNRRHCLYRCCNEGSHVAKDYVPSWTKSFRKIRCCPQFGRESNDEAHWFQ